MSSVGDALEPSGFAPGDRALLLTLVALIAGVGIGYGARSASPTGEAHPVCAVAAAQSSIDLWRGRWDVYVGERRLGRDVVTTAPSGCALDDRRTDVGGSLRRSVLVFDRASGAWSEALSKSYRPHVQQRVRIVRIAEDAVRRVTEESVDGADWRPVLAETLVRATPKA